MITNHDLSISVCNNKPAKAHHRKLASVWAVQIWGVILLHEFQWAAVLD